MDQASIKKQFYQWLSARVSKNVLSNLYIRVDDIDSYCQKIGIADTSLIGMVDLETISKIKDVVYRNKVFKFKHKKHINEYIAITNHYYDFIKNYYLLENKSDTIEGSDASTKNNDVKTESYADEKPFEKVSLKDFIQWMCNEKYIAETTARLYASSITWCEKFMCSRNIGSGKLCAASRAEAKTNIEKLLENQEFIDENSKKRYRFFASLKKFAEYRNLESISFPMKREHTNSPISTPEIRTGADIDLHEKYPVLFRQVYDLLKKSGNTGVTAQDILNRLDKKVRLTTITTILNAASWSYQVNEKYIFSSKANDNTPVMKKNNTPSDFDKKRFEQTLLQRYRNGMQFDSIDFDNFRETYELLFDETLTFNDSELKERLLYCGVFYKERLFPSEGIIDSKTREQLFAYIESSFSSGKKILYYKAIFEDLTDLFACCFTLSDEKMLKAYIEYTAEDEKYFFFPDFMSIEEHVSIDHSIEVEQFLLNTGKPVTCEAVCEALSHIPKNQVEHIVKTGNRFLRNAKGEFFHVAIFEISESEIDSIADIIMSYIDQNEYAIWTDIWQEIQNKMPSFIENNLYLSSLGIRNALAQSYKERFDFNGTVISMPEKQYSMKDIYQLYAKHHPEFSADDIYNLSKELASGIYFEALYSVSVRISHDLFVSKDEVDFDVESVDKAIESFCSNDYICIREIDSYLTFPNVGYEWNEYLLESFIYSYSKSYTLLNNGFALNNVAGVVIKKDGPFYDFVDVCALVLANGPISLNKKDALSYLAEVNMITKKSYWNIDSAIRKATQIRAMKG